MNATDESTIRARVLDSRGPTPRAGVPAPYAPQVPRHPINLRLDANEGPPVGVDLAAIARRIGAEGAQRYPATNELRRAIADRVGTCESRILVTAGGDEAIDRACRAFLEPGAEIIVPVPTFEMIGRYASLAGATIVTTPWEFGAFPVDAVIGSISPRTRMIAMVTPNNPTGAVASAADLSRVALAAPDAIILVDLAYTEFADTNLTAVAMELPNTVIIRTFSKAYGLAGLRVGYAIATDPVIRSLRACGSPFPVSALSMAAAVDAVRDASGALERSVERIRRERSNLSVVLRELGARPQPSQANFVIAAFDDAAWVWDALAGLGIGVRRFGGGSRVEGSLRITCPGNATDFDRLCRALRTVLRPEALLLDMDGVIADVSASYRRAIELTAGSFGVVVTPQDVARAKERGNANNDWVVTHGLIAGAGVTASLAEVTARFERAYQGTADAPGLRASESLLVGREQLDRLAGRVRLGIVTGRPRRDAEAFLRRFDLEDVFEAVVCMEDAPAKPDPGPIRVALERMGCVSAWMVGDTPDDIVAARAGGVVPIGIAAPGADPDSQKTAMESVGAARVARTLSDLERILP